MLTRPAVLACAGGITLYVMAVTVFAAGETHRQNVKPKVLMITAAAAAWLVGLVVTVRPPSFEALWMRWLATGLGTLTFIYLAVCLGRMGDERPHLVSSSGPSGTSSGG